MAADFGTDFQDDFDSKSRSVFTQKMLNDFEAHISQSIVSSNYVLTNKMVSTAIFALASPSVESPSIARSLIDPSVAR